MSSSFLSALARVKETTKDIVENATVQLSTKLQMSLNSAPCTSVSSFHTSGHVNPKKANPVPQIGIPKSTSNISNRSSTVYSPVTYTNPVIMSTSPQTDVNHSDVQDYAISKSTNSGNISESPLGFTSAPSLKNTIILDVNGSTPTNASSNFHAPSVPAQSVAAVTSTFSNSYTCASNDCFLPSCLTNNSCPQSIQVESSANVVNIENTINEAVNSSEFESSLHLATESSSYVSSKCNIPDNSIRNSVSDASVHSVSNTLGTETFSKVTALPVNVSESSERHLQKSHNTAKVSNPKRHCLFCDTRGHSSHNCCKFNTSTEFWNIIYQKRLCKNCLRPFHFSEKCFDSNFCLFSSCRRRDKHSPILCKHRYNFNKSHPKYNSYKPFSEIYQDVCLNLTSHNEKRFYSQGTQTNFVVESKTVETQTVSTEDILFFLQFLNENSVILPVLQSCI